MNSLGNRMKENYENRYRMKLTRRMPVIMRLDGKAFHTLTRKCDKPFDEELQLCMVDTARSLCSEIQGTKMAYIQSDEISLLLTDFDTLQTDAWFDYNIQKMCSVSAGIASASFSYVWLDVGIFDSRVFNVPKEEVCNYFIWRQKDWERNSIQMLSQSHFSHKQLHKKKLLTCMKCYIQWVLIGQSLIISGRMEPVCISLKDTGQRKTRLFLQRIEVLLKNIWNQKRHNAANKIIEQTSCSSLH